VILSHNEILSRQKNFAKSEHKKQNYPRNTRKGDLQIALRRTGDRRSLNSAALTRSLF
jgi:hypothetical protein